MLFMTAVLVLLALLFLFMGVVAPRGEFLGMDYKLMPGINTPTTTASKGAWQAAHRTVASINLFISLYYVACLVALWVNAFHVNEAVFGGMILVGMLMFIPVLLAGNRAAQAFLDNEDRYPVSHEPRL